MEDAYIGQAQDAALGREFLTWLWFKSEEKNGLFQGTDNLDFSLYVEQRVSVQGGEGESLETATVSGRMSELREARLGLSTGKKVSRALVRMERDAEAWQVNVKAEDFSLSGFKTPKAETKTEEGDDPDALFLERVFLLEKALGFLDHVFAGFVRLRLSPGWAEECAAIRIWLAKS
ncbi:MAG: hypothetical protein AB1916_09980 [Thermodesulfobacteriota bacterium]